MTKSNLLSLKTQAEIERFHNLLIRCGNIYLADINRVDLAYNKIKDHVENQYSKGVIKF
jgi:hypothetical protein